VPIHRVAKNAALLEGRVRDLEKAGESLIQLIPLETEILILTRKDSPPFETREEEFSPSTWMGF
jgi:hypothetical protein